MAKKATEEMTEPMMEGTPSAETATPNRDAYSQMWGEDNSDIDFEDKEARYGRAIDDRNELRERRKADAALGGMFDSHDWLATMYSELSENPDINPFEWLAGFCQENDVSLEKVLNDPEAQKRLSEKMSKHNERKAKDKETQKAREDAVAKSAEELKTLGLDEEEMLSVWGDFWKIIEEADEGVVSADTWKAFMNSRNYDADVESARNEGAMKARNERIQNKVRRPSEEMDDMPPTLNQGASAAPKRQPKQEDDSFLAGLNG